ncbi:MULTISPECIES: ubiquinol oxidase subunit II [Chelativorans]|jgi:cytochrome o ubiquinol oxidase subunit 2|uniref:ubiquinol oxidase subunit II n=1 Tax=Chelativorans TaxID=449972 RepID=UPI00030170B2|nr:MULTISPECIES: ubiquinol oxidase subunit II [Chelativorans]
MTKRQAIFSRSRGLLAAIAALPLGGCVFSRSPVIDPKGPIALAERDLLFTALAVMLIVVIPVFLMTFLFVTRYRASNKKARYAPDWSFSPAIETVVWVVPALIVIALGVLLWNATHKLDPYRTLAAKAEPLEVLVIAQDWKWLFIYPSQGVAAVNELVFPSGRPVNLRITSDTVMNSFYVPALAGQIYAMAGIQTRLNFLANAPGTFTGRNTQYSGDGFADQHFSVMAETPAGFEAWLQRVRQSPGRLDAAAYESLAKPSIGHPVTYYSGVQPGLFESVIAKYAAHPAAGHSGHE